jgi:hypothetical protein
MSESARFKKLQRRIDQLKIRLIPKTRPAGNYTAREQDLIRAYRLLSHAEFESYLEDRALEIATKALHSFVVRGKTGHALAAMMSFSPLSPQSPPGNLNTSNIDLPTNRVHRVVSQYKLSVSHANHGIKESNIISMLFPIGFIDSELDVTLLATLSSYGGNRGSTAHQSAHTQIPIDPVSEVVTVDWITEELKKLDILLTKKKREN